jgi:hypothetical protein
VAGLLGVEDALVVATGGRFTEFLAEASKDAVVSFSLCCPELVSPSVASSSSEYSASSSSIFWVKDVSLSAKKNNSMYAENIIPVSQLRKYIIIFGY